MIQNKPLLLRALAGALICIPVYASAGNASYYNASTEAKVFPWKKNKKKEKKYSAYFRRFYEKGSDNMFAFDFMLYC